MRQLLALVRRADGRLPPMPESWGNPRITDAVLQERKDKDGLRLPDDRRKGITAEQLVRVAVLIRLGVFNLFNQKTLGAIDRPISPTISSA